MSGQRRLGIFLIFIITGLIVIIWGCSKTEQRQDVNEPKELNNPLEVVSYSIEGKDGQGGYTGIVSLYPDENNREGGPVTVTASREIRYAEGKLFSFTGVGTLSKNQLQMKYQSRRSASAAKTEDKHVQIHTGYFDEKQEKGTMFYRAAYKQEIVDVRETWTLKEQKPLTAEYTETVTVKNGQWVSIPLKMKTPGVVKVSIPGTVNPVGIFLPRGEKPPDVGKLERPDAFRPGVSQKTPVSRMMGIQTMGAEIVWLNDFTKVKGAEEMEFRFKDDGIKDNTQFDIDITIFDPFDPFPTFCNPMVSIDVSPNIAAVGEPITITVRALAFAGLDMFWWFGENTGITDLDKAHIMAGSGLYTGRYTWTITIDQPGTYTFGANARDELYWVQHGVPHQASEGCGLDYDSVEVRADIRKSYNMAFVVLAPEGTDINNPEFRDHLAKVEGLKTALVDQFVTSTDGMGVVDTSYPIITLTPPGPVYDISDGGLMWDFVCGALRQYFYTRHPDIFDFIAIYETYPDKDVVSRHLSVREYVGGFGITPRDFAAHFGFGGKLRGIGAVTDLNLLPVNYDFTRSRMQLLLHEVFGHQWGMYAAEIGERTHFEIGVESPTFTVLYGRPWRKIDETHFTTANVQDPATGTFKIMFHPWTLYVAGMKLRGEIPPRLMKVAPDRRPANIYDLVTTTGTYEWITLQTVINQSEGGDRFDVHY